MLMMLLDLTDKSHWTALHDNLRSDDPHVLALARTAGVRLLYTGDRDLMADFKNKELIDRPRGRVYTGAANAPLLTAVACAGRRR